MTSGTIVMLVAMNSRGHPNTLVASHPGNMNAVRCGVHSERLITAAADELRHELFSRFEFTPSERVAASEVARCMALLDAIDRALDERGVADARGKSHYLLDRRIRVSRQLERWLEKIAPAIERKAIDEEDAVCADRSDYVRELQRIALGRDGRATTRDRLEALRLLIGLGESGTTSVMERLDPSIEDDADLAAREAAIARAERNEDVERRQLGWYMRTVYAREGQPDGSS